MRFLPRRYAPVLYVVVLLTSACAHNLHIERGITYAEPKRETLRATIYAPEGKEMEEPRPGILLVHGGGWMFGGRNRVSWYAKRFARNGYVAMSIDYRKLPDYPFPACLHDAKAAVRWMRMHAEDLNMDPDRLAAFGSSAGGHIVGMLATTRPDDGFEGTENLGPSSEIDAALILYGAVDLTAYRAGLVGRTGSWFIRKLVKPFFDPGENVDMDEFEWASPITYVHSGTPPVHLTHGTWDTIVPYVQSERFYEALQRAGIPSELQLYEKRNHAFDWLFPGERRELFNEMEQWLDSVLLGEEAEAGSP